jgi:hypothetical protein
LSMFFYIGWTGIFPITNYGAIVWTVIFVIYMIIVIMFFVQTA